jgi:N-acyl-D-aspartate/D-glutamate deacylase
MMGHMGDLLVRGGTIVDGTGGPSRVGDVRVRDGVIVEIGERLALDGESEIDASSALVTPGLIDPHTHYDLEMFWDPTLDPLPTYGMTTIVMGNCGLGIAPVRDDVRDDIADLLCFIEELPPSLAMECVPWGWSTWSEYRTVAAQTATTVTPFAYTAHNALRGFTMGRDAWERAATDSERAAMVALLDDALAHGSLGMSTNWFDTDRNRALVPSRLSDAAEIDALLEVLARYPHATLQVIARNAEDRRPVLERSLAHGVRVLSLGNGVGGVTDTDLPVHRLGGGAEPFTPRLGFESTIAAAAVPAWHEMINGPEDDKLALLGDPDWRARARHDWDHPHDEQNAFRKEELHVLILSDSENGTGPVGISLKDLAEQRAVHPSDALADWVLANGIGSRYTKLSVRPQESQVEMDNRVKASFDDPYALIGGTDAGAHLKMFCGAGANVYVLTHWARDEGAVTVEQAVHCMTQRNASFFSLHDRGVIAEGTRGDLAVFALDEIETRDYVRATDLPDGGWRFTRPSAGFRATVVGGVPTVLDGEPTGARPTHIGHALRSASGSAAR